MIRINPDEIPEEVYEIGCRVLSKSIRKFYDDPENRRKYEVWKDTEDGRRANLSKEERERFDAEHIRKRGGETTSCVICGEIIRIYGNNAEPVARGECCNTCNLRIVVPARIKQIDLNQINPDSKGVKHDDQRI